MGSQNRNNRLVAEYLNGIRIALKDLPPARRNPIIDEISEHIQTARSQMQDEDEAAIRQLLVHMGDPESIRTEAGLPLVRLNSWGDRWAPWLLLFGGFVFILGWFLGVVLLWQSSIWRTGEKLVATLVWPGGLAAVVYGLGVGIGVSGTATSTICTRRGHGPLHCTATGSGSHMDPILSILIIVVAIAAPIVVNARLLKVYRMASLGQ